MMTQEQYDKYKQMFIINYINGDIELNFNSNPIHQRFLDDLNECIIGDDVILIEKMNKPCYGRLRSAHECKITDVGAGYMTVQSVIDNKHVFNISIPELLLCPDGYGLFIFKKPLID